MPAQDLEQVRETNSDLQAILSSIYDEILVVDPHGTIIWVSDHFLADVWNMEPDEMIGQNVLSLEKRGLFTPSVVRLVLESKAKVTTIQEAWNGDRILATGTPVLTCDGSLER
ncbi:MAG: Fis family transcriptional regulator, partial [Clostridia bacterium]